ncbi:hypothetical protein BJ322DRAFT_1164997 [Thelephora terrestris]|uniref:Decapping nuclease n=1 Tax=Thelephora terrestris TaxID=56493 RepID=A0A9P6H5J2_9AGAM|nr:hypothetical protein BJ322DRAFT_1164997 [Thelephora terrestris]
MSLPHFLGNFATPARLDKRVIGPSQQIAYYSLFPGPTHRYRYQSRDALKLYSPPTVPFPLVVAPPDRDRAAWSNQCNYLDSLPQPGVQPIIASCLRAGCTADLAEADVIANRGTLVDLAMGKEEEYGVSFVDRKLRILGKSFVIQDSDCFENVGTRPMTKRPRGIFFSVVRRKIGNHDVIMSGEVDCSSSTDNQPNMKDYIGLNTIKVPEQWPRPEGGDSYSKWYLQSYLLGVPTLQIGYRNYKNHVFHIIRKPAKEFLPELQIYTPMFDPAVDMGRVHAILSALSAYFRALGPSVSATDRFVLRVGANGDAYIAAPKTLRTRRPRDRRAP